MSFWEAVIGGRSVGVPGLLRMLELAHADHGRLPWARLFEPAIRLAENGFAVSPRLHALIAEDRYLTRYPEAAAYFPDAAGNPLPVGAVPKNQAHADKIAAWAAGGALSHREGGGWGTGGA